MLVLSTVVFYWPIIQCQFVNLDDGVYVYENPHIRSGLSAEGIMWAFTTTYAHFWHPLTWLSHLFDYEIFGLKPWGHHLMALLWHTANAVLVFFILRKMTAFVWRSAFVAALFALHPLHVESVAWVSERKDVLSTFFGLLSILFYVAYVQRRDGKGAGEKGRKGEGENPPGSLSPFLPFYLLSLLFFALSLMSKPMLVTLPFVLLLLDFWPLARVSSLKWDVSGSGTSNFKLQTSNLSKLFLEKLPFFVLTAVFCVIAFLVPKSGGAIATLEHISLSSRLANSVVSYWHYVQKLFWPKSLAPFYPFYAELPPFRIILGTILLIGVSVLAIFWRKRRPYLVTGWFWFVGTLVPVIGLVQVGSHSMADRYTYIPLIGLFIILCWGIAEVVSAKLRKPLGFVFVLGLVILGFVTRAQVRVWTNDFTLNQHALAVTANNFVAHNNLGMAYEAEGKWEEAAKHFAAAIQINPHYGKGRDNLGVMLARIGKPSEAIPHFEATLKAAPENYWAHNNLGMALLETGKGPEAVQHFEESLRFNPNYPEAHMNLAYALAQLRRPGVEEHFKKAIELQPDFASAHLNYAHWLFEQGRIDEAIAHFERTLNIDPQSTQARYELASAFYAQGKAADAVRQWREVLKLDPEHAEALNNLAWIFATHPTLYNGEEAVRYAEQAIKGLREENLSALDTLAAAYARLGKYDQAIATVEKAIAGAEAMPRPELVEKYKERLKRYRAGQPWTEP